MNPDILGWFGAAGLILFYWLMGSQKIMAAYICSTIGAACFLVVGVMSFFEVEIKLPSLIFMESVVILLNLRAMWQWRNKKVIDK